MICPNCKVDLPECEHCGPVLEVYMAPAPNDDVWWCEACMIANGFMEDCDEDATPDN
jgi:hypothetical protein